MSEENNLALVFDEDTDGTIDSVIEYKTNGINQIISVSLDNDDDGNVDRKIFFEYDNEGRLSKKLKDSNNNGVIDSIVIYEYDQEGNVTVHYDDNADGKVDYIETKDNNGEIVITDVRDLKQKMLETLPQILPFVKIKKEIK